MCSTLQVLLFFILIFFYIFQYRSSSDERDFFSSFILSSSCFLLFFRLHTPFFLLFFFTFGSVELFLQSFFHSFSCLPRVDAPSRAPARSIRPGACCAAILNTQSQRIYTNSSTPRPFHTLAISFWKLTSRLCRHSLTLR